MPMRALLVTALGHAFRPVFGEIIKIKNQPLPGSYNLQGLAAFTVYMPEDAPEKGGEKPFVEYRNLRAHSVGWAPFVQSYAGLQLALLSEADYKNYIEKDPLCNQYGRLHSPAGVAQHTVQLTSQDCGMSIDGGGWQLVRHTAGTGGWGPFTDNLIGVDTVWGPGTSTDEHHWTIPWDIDNVHQFLFATGNCKHWLIAEPSAVVGNATYSEPTRGPIVKSSISKTGYAATWYNRFQFVEDPWISITDHVADATFDDMLYGEGLGTTHDGLKNNNSGANVYVRSQTHVELNATGTYFLVMANCGTFSQGEVSGEVAVKNPSGYLSATDYHKMYSYVWIFIMYAVLASVWTVLCIIQRLQLTQMHGIIGIVISLRLFESGAWLDYLSTLNHVGDTAESTVCVLVVLGVLTTYTQYICIICVSQGWRMTEEALDVCLLIKLGLFGLLWIAVSYFHEGAMTYRHSHHISSEFMIVTTILAMFVNLAVFVWIFVSLGRLRKKLKERHLDDQLQAISRFTTGLIVAVVLGGFVGFAQILDSAGILQVAWKYQFWADGGGAHVITIFMVAVSMWVWMPSAGSPHFGYSLPVEQFEEEDGGGEHGHGNKVAPNTVGVWDDDSPCARDEAER